MFLFYVLSFFKKGDTIQGGTLFKEIWYMNVGPEKFDKKNKCRALTDKNLIFGVLQ